jgi:hypothetical protein
MGKSGYWRVPLKSILKKKMTTESPTVVVQKTRIQRLRRTTKGNFGEGVNVDAASI